jgi:hypothetical protein
MGRIVQVPAIISARSIALPAASRGRCESLTKPGDFQARFSLGGGGREVPRSVAVERLHVRANWAKTEVD